MKKFSAMIVTCAMMTCALASCGSADKIVGKWELEGVADSAEGIDGGGLIFDKDGNGSFYEDTSSLFYFEDSGINVGGYTFDNNYINYDGSTFSLSVEGMEMLKMERKGSPEPDKYIGDYNLVGGFLYETITSGIAQGSGTDDVNDIPISISFEENHSEVIFDDVFEYEVKGSKIKISNCSSFLESMMDSDVANAYFEIDDDTLILKDSKKGDDKNTLKRVE